MSLDVDAATPRILVIEAGRGSRQYWRDIWNYRELLYFLTWRDILVRYKQTAIGISWSVIRPLLIMIVGVALQRILKIPFDVAAPAAVVIYAGVLPWQFFGDALTQSSNSLVQSAQIVSKVYFPRILMPVSKVAVSLVDFCIALSILGILMAWYGYAPSWQIVALPALLLIAGAASLGIGLFFAAMNVRFRDFMYVVPFIVQFGVYVSPVFYPAALIPERYRMFYFINPMAGVIELFRWAILRGESPVYLPGVAISLAVIAALLTFGLWYFRRTERTFADII